MQRIECAAVADGVRRCALLRVRAAGWEATRETWTAHGLQMVALTDAQPGGRSPAAAKTGTMMAAIGRATDLPDLQDAWDRNDGATLGMFLGYPDCCIESFAIRCEKDRWMDPTWAIAVHTVHSVQSATVLELVASPVTNILWRCVGVRAVPHVPCRFDCGPSVDLGASFLQIGARIGCDEEVHWLQEVLSWPVGWSALHGIAEVKTPILKLATSTDATADKLVVRWKGDRYPEEGAPGVSFPYSERPSAKKRCGSDHQEVQVVQIQRRRATPLGSTTT